MEFEEIINKTLCELEVERNMILKDYGPFLKVLGENISTIKVMEYNTINIITKYADALVLIDEKIKLLYEIKKEAK